MPVYFVRAGNAGPVKIGWAKDTEARRKQLQVSHGEPLQVIRSIDGTRKTEQWLHERYAAGRQVGEWFLFDAEMLEVEPPDLGPVRVNWRGRKKAAQAEKAKIEVVSWVADRCTIQRPCALCRGLVHGIAPVSRLGMGAA